MTEKYTKSARKNKKEIYKKSRENGKVKNVIFYVLYCPRFYSVAMV